MKIIDPLLSIKNLYISFEQFNRTAHALRGIDLSIEPGEIHALVGESGSGKTVTATSIIGLLPTPPGKINSGTILFNKRDILLFPEHERRKTRGKEIGMIFQEPGKYLNPALKVGSQITEMLQLHLEMNKKDAVNRAFEILDLVGLGADKKILNSYPHELSGGMKQRVMIAIAISCNPSLLIADEPTTALDVTLQLQILKLLLQLRTRLSMSILFVSHDLGVVYIISDKISVIYAGKIVESASKENLFNNPLHPYTRLLLLSIPDAKKRGTKLKTIPGKVPDAENIPSGCAFHQRCPIAEQICKEQMPETIKYENGHTAACHFIGEKWIDL